MSAVAGMQYNSYFNETDRKKPWNFREFLEVEQPGLDDTLTTDDLAVLAREVVNREIITVIEDARIGRNLIDVIKINGATETFYKEFGFQAAVVPQAAEIPLGKTRYEKMHITPFKVGIRPQLTYEAIADGQIPILQRNIKQAVLAMARFEDAHIMTVLNAGVPDGTVIVGTREAVHTFGATNNVLTWDDMVRAYTAIILENLTPTDIVIHPFQLAQVLRMTAFRQYIGVGTGRAATMQPGFQLWNSRTEMAYGSGRIGTILGCTIWITNTQTAGVLLMIDKNNYGILAERQPLLTESDRDIIHQMQTVAFSQRYAAGVLNNDGASNITALASAMTEI